MFATILQAHTFSRVHLCAMYNGLMVASVRCFTDAGDSVSAAVPPTTDTFVPQPWGSESHKP